MGGPGSGRISRKEFADRLDPDSGLQKVMDDIYRENPDGSFEFKWTEIRPTSKFQPRKSLFKHHIQSYFAGDLSYKEVTAAWVYLSLYLGAKLRDKLVAKGHVEEGLLLENLLAGLPLFSKEPSDIWKLYESILMLCGSIAEEDQLIADANIDPETLVDYLPDPKQLTELPQFDKEPETKGEG